MWAGITWKTGLLINGKRIQRMKLVKDLDLELDYDEECYEGLY